MLKIKRTVSLVENVAKLNSFYVLTKEYDRINLRVQKIHKNQLHIIDNTP